MSDVATWLGRYQNSFIDVYGQPKTVLTRGSGCRVWDIEGREYLDFLAGIAVNVLGHAHPAICQAIAQQATELMQVSNFFATPSQIALGEKIAELAAGQDHAKVRVFLANSGTEANEAALKITRKTGRKKIVAMVDSFHGRSMGALSLTHKLAYREPFFPLLPDVVFVPFGDAKTLADTVDEQTAAIVMEPIQGEAGVIVPPPGFLASARQIADQHGALLWFDEVQTGMGRTGHWFAWQAEGVRPDLMTLAKGLGGGFPIGACVAFDAASELLVPGNHGTTFGGNPLAAAVALAVIKEIEQNNLLLSVQEKGQYLAQQVLALGHSKIIEVRGAGLLRAIVLAEDIAPAVVTRAQAAGFILNAPRPNVLRLVPPLIVSEAEIAKLVEAMGDWL